LILGGSTGTGSIAIQIAKQIPDATVLATTSSKNANFVKELGADHVIDYSQGNVAESVKKIVPGGVDLLYDCIGEAALTDQVLSTVRDKGTVISIAAWSLMEKLSKEQRFTYKMFVVEPNAPQLETIARLFEEGKFKPLKTTVLPLADVNKAWDMSKSERTVGKLVLKI